MTPIPGKENLQRAIGVRALTLAILNSVVGTGIFAIPAIIAGKLGTAAIIAYLVCGVLIFLIALCFAELGSKTAASGGVYEYIETAFGPFAGFLANNIYWFGACVIADAATANILADALKFFFPSLEGGVFRISFFIFIFTMLALINIRSVKNGIRFVEIATFAKLIPLVLLVIAGVKFISFKNLAWTSFPSVEHIGDASLLLFFAFMGMETPLTNGGEIKNAKRTVPLALFLGILFVLILYMSLQLVTQGVLGESIAAHSDAPLAAVAGIIFGAAGISIMVIATSVSTLGNLAGDTLSIPRMLFAGARDGLMPKVLARVHPRFFTPHIAVIFYSGLGLLFAIFGTFHQLAILATAATLIIYFGTVLATIKLRKKNIAESEKTFRVPGGVIIPLLAVCVIIWLLSSLSAPELKGIGIFILVFSLIYFLIKFFKKKSLK